MDIEVRRSIILVLGILVVFLDPTKVWTVMSIILFYTTFLAATKLGYTIAIGDYIWYAFKVGRCVEDLEDAVERLLEMQDDLLRLDPQPSAENGMRWVKSVQDLRGRAEAIRIGLHGLGGLNYLSKCRYLGKQADKELERAAPLVERGKALLKEAWRMQEIQTQTGYLDLLAYPLDDHQWRCGIANDLQRSLRRLQEIQEDLLRRCNFLRLGDAHPYSARCKGWKKSVQALRLKAEERGVMGGEHGGCGKTSCAKCYKIGKQSAKLLEIATHLAAEGKGLFIMKPAAWQMLAPVSQNRTIEDLIGTNLPPLPAGMSSYEMDVLSFVERSTAGAPWLLGIRGMRGVGKTTLLRFVRDSYAHGSSFFHHVFFLGAGAGCTVRRLQDVLSINISPPYGQTRTSHLLPMADFITSSLRRKTFLLLIDDVVERLDLAAVGLPMPLEHNQKVIFTTRNRAICTDMGCASKAIQMKCLAEDDAWSLFKEKVGDQVINTHPHVKRLAEKMVAECRGLPSALCTLGRAMSTKRDVKEWRYAYDVLLKCKPPHHQVDEIQEMGDEGYSHLHQLEDALRDSCFF